MLRPTGGLWPNALPGVGGETGDSERPGGPHPMSLAEANSGALEP